MSERAPNESPDEERLPASVITEQDLQPIIPALRVLIKEEAQHAITTVMQSESHSGPIPSPAQLAKYDVVRPGTADVIVNEYQANSAHVRNMEKQALSALKSDNDLNRRVAERLVWGSLASVIGLALSGHDAVATAVAITTVGAVIAGFLTGRKPATEEPENVSKDL